MSVAIAFVIEDAKPAGRKAQAFAFITDYLINKGSSPSIGDIALALGVGPTRAKTLVHQLALAKMIDRAAGAHRGISVPGLQQQIAIERLRIDGYRVDKDIEGSPACPQGHLPIVAILGQAFPTEPC